MPWVKELEGQQGVWEMEVGVKVAALKEQSTAKETQRDLNQSYIDDSSLLTPIMKRKAENKDIYLQLSVFLHQL